MELKSKIRIRFILFRALVILLTVAVAGLAAGLIGYILKKGLPYVSWEFLTTEPDILILDEVLSVGDKKFRQKSENKVMSMFDKGVTVLFVSHSLEQVKRLCDRAIILDSGRLVAEGPVDKIARVYKNMTE